MDDHVLGVLGGGQLGRMLVDAANDLNIKVAVLDSERAPAKQNNAAAVDVHVTGSFAKAADVRVIAENCDVLTFEIEHVDTQILEELDAERPFLPNSKWARIQPSWQTVRTIQDKYAQKEHLTAHGIPVVRSIAVDASQPQALKDVGEKFGYPLMLKSRTEAYDGRGNCPVKSASDIEAALQTLKDRPLYAEQWADFTMELAVMVVKTKQEAFGAKQGHLSALEGTHAYPVVETVHENSICKLVYAPARNVSEAIQQDAQNLARAAVASFAGTGVFGVEMFLLQDRSLVINEIAPRPHNSGHYTIEACHMSQYEAHLRAVLPELSTTIRAGATDFATEDMNAIMLNILGGPHPYSHLVAAKAALRIPGAKIHMYGKGAGRPGRKMGHVTLLGSSMSECEEKIGPFIALVDDIRSGKET